MIVLIWIGYYTFLRIIVTIGACLVVFNELSASKGLNSWVIIFGIIAIVFNPIIPVYLHSKSAWAPIDIIAGILFVVKVFVGNTNGY